MAASQDMTSGVRANVALLPAELGATRGVPVLQRSPSQHSWHPTKLPLPTRVLKHVSKPLTHGLVLLRQPFPQSGVPTPALNRQ